MNRALSLFIVLIIAKLCVIADRATWDALSLLAYFWQDGLVALVFAVFEYAFRRNGRVVAIGYYALIAYAALNVPIARLTSSPLTIQMIRATGSALSDSIHHHLTPVNLVLITIILTAGIALPRLLRGPTARAHTFSPSPPEERRRRGGSPEIPLSPSPLPTPSSRGDTPLLTRIALPVLLLFCVCGAWASTRVTLHGYDRNAVTALTFSFLPHVESRPSSRNWRASSAVYPEDPDLAGLRSAARGRNVVLIALESTGAQYLRPCGATNDPMPNLTRLADQAVLFDNAYAVYPESIKGLFSVLCATYPAFDTEAKDYERVTTPSIAQVLRDEGYRTGLFHSGRFMYLGMRSIVENRGFEALEDAGDIGGNHNSSFGVDEPSTVKRILNWTASLKPGERFFLHYLPIAGHHPYETPEPGPFPGGDDRSRYLNALHYADAAVAQLMRGLKEQGHDTDTLFVIYGDHSEAFGGHPENFGHTFFLYEENVHVPLLIVAPGLITKPVRVQNPASLVDIGPTITDLLGVSSEDPHLDVASASTSLSPRHRSGERAGERGFSEGSRSWQGVSLLDSEPRTALFFTDYSLPLVGIRDGPWKFISETSGRGAQLFDLSSDADETRSLARNRTEQVADYRMNLADWAGAQKARLTERLMATGITNCELRIAN